MSKTWKDSRNAKQNRSNERSFKMNPYKRTNKFDSDDYRQ